MAPAAALKDPEVAKAGNLGGFVEDAEKNTRLQSSASEVDSPWPLEKG